MKGFSTIMVVGTLLAFPLVAPAHADETAKKPNSAAYPNSPGGDPAAGDKGAPVETDKSACTGSKCPDKPAPSADATGEKAERGGIRTPSTAYPDSPVKTPATEQGGKPPR